MARSMKLHMVSLGCARNQVDSETMVGSLLTAGWSLTQQPRDADAIVINTCSFVESAVSESIDTILEYAELKQSGRCRFLIVAGCLPERYGQSISESLPEVDYFIGTGAYDHIVTVLEDLKTVDPGHQNCLLPDPDRIEQTAVANRALLQYPHLAYLKVAEGCSRHCTYCIIPKLRGRRKSRPPKTLVAEARRFMDQGVKELILVAQDTTDYGADLVPPIKLSELIQQLARATEEVWLRVLYGHPVSLDSGFLDTVARHASICPYFDIPIQHASQLILKRMGREYTAYDLRRLFNKIRQHLPQAVLRTTVIVGFPGETQSDFETLLAFIEEIGFDHLGAFVYSDADDLASHGLPDHVPPEVAQARCDQLMAAQLKISAQRLERYLGQTLTVLVDEIGADGVGLGRTQFQAPEVDGLVYVHGPDVIPGQWVQVQITDTLEYDLVGGMV